MEALYTVLIGLGSSLATAFAQWIFYFKKHTAEAKSVVKNNDRAEIENLNLIAKEWREAAKIWKDMVDEYHLKSMDNMRRIEELEQKVFQLQQQLMSANKQIDKLKTKTS
jgi:Mg2+ and Co2+ transporter CorA